MYGRSGWQHGMNSLQKMNIVKKYGKKCKEVDEKWKEEEKKQITIEKNWLITWEKWKKASELLSIAQIQYELVAVELLCETEGATYISNIIHSYLVDLNKNNIK